MVGLLVDLIKGHLAPWLGNVWDSLLLWRSVALLAFVLVAVAWTARRPLAGWVLGVKGREHDIALFKRMDGALNEGALDLLLNRDIYNQSIGRVAIYSILYFCQDFTRAETQFIDRRLRGVAQPFLTNLRSVERFVAQHFFPMQSSDGTRWSKLYPKNNISLETRKALTKELNDLIDKAWESYQQFRRTLKSRLQV